MMLPTLSFDTSQKLWLEWEVRNIHIWFFRMKRKRNLNMTWFGILSLPLILYKLQNGENDDEYLREIVVVLSIRELKLEIGGVEVSFFTIIWRLREQLIGWLRRRRRNLRMRKSEIWCHHYQISWTKCDNVRIDYFLNQSRSMTWMIPNSGLYSGDMLLSSVLSILLFILIFLVIVSYIAGRMEWHWTCTSTRCK